MRTLLALDGSRHAMEAAHALGHLAPAELVLVLHVVEAPVPPAYPWFPVAAHEMYRTVERDLWEDGERLLKRTVPILPNGIGPVLARCDRGRPADVITATAERENIDLIVMGARGLSVGEALVFGSVSHRVMTHATASVLVVNHPLPTLRKLVVAVEGPEDADRLLRFFEKRVFSHPVEMDVLTVLELPEGKGSSEEDTELARRSARRFSEDVASRLSSVQCCAVPVARTGSPPETILQHAAEVGPDLLVLGARARSTVSRWLFGSVSHAVVHRSPCPVLIIR